MTRTFVAATRYELAMQVRKRSVWTVAFALVALLLLVSRGQLAGILDEPDPRYAMVLAGLLLNVLVPVGFGCLLADRLIRDARLGVGPVLDATPASPGARLAGKYVGSCVATGLPVLVLYGAFVATYAVVNSSTAALGWGALVFLTVITPALLFVGAFALVGPLFMPAPLFRVLFVGYWFWGNIVSPTMMPTLALTLLAPIGGYAIEGFLGYRGEQGTTGFAGPVDGALFNLLRPEATAATATLSLAILLGMAGSALVTARLMAGRTSG